MIHKKCLFCQYIGVLSLQKHLSTNVTCLLEFNMVFSVYCTCITFFYETCVLFMREKKPIYFICYLIRVVICQLCRISIAFFFNLQGNMVQLLLLKFSKSGFIKQLIAFGYSFCFHYLLILFSKCIITRYVIIEIQVYMIV